jgi:hypothetical protein
MFLVENGYLPSAGVTQLVECDLAKVDVAGSNPVSRSKFCPVLNRIALPVGFPNETNGVTSNWPL